MENTGYFNMDVGMSYVNSKYYAHLTIKNLLFSPHNMYGILNTITLEIKHHLRD